MSGAAILTAVLSDVHSNLSALTSVLDDARSRGAGRFWFLGDAVGYGPDPNECVDLLFHTASVMVLGNHDAAVLRAEEAARFNRYAAEVVDWTRNELDSSNIAVLHSMRLTASVEDVLLVHASPDEPGMWYYLTGAPSVASVANSFIERICMVGHTHAPFIVELRADGRLFTHQKAVAFAEGSRYVINAGSVGQPRDGDPRAAYVLMGAGHAEVVRVSYDIAECKRRMRERGLPEPLIRRLAMGV